METVRLERHADVPLEFTGELIAEISSECDGNERWEEWRVWRTDSDKVKWVAQQIARSAVPGERDFIHTFKCKTPIDLRFALRRQDGDRWYLTDLALETLDAAAEADDRLAPALIERL